MSKKILKYLSVGISGTVIGLGAKYLYDKRKESEWEQVLYAEVERQLNEVEENPTFDIGDRVLFLDPIVGGVFATTDGSAATYIIEDVKYDEIDGVYRYKVEGVDQWYSENWLDFVDFEGMAKHSSEMFKSDGAISDKMAEQLEIDYWLQSYAYEKEQGNEEGVRLAVDEINRLRGIVNDGK